MAVATYNKAGAAASAAASLDASVFDVKINNHELLKQAYVTYLANGRENHAVTKTRGLVSGGGRKPWKQKGTGRARFGSTRNPIWRGGGVAFGPTGQENYTKNLNVKAKRLAIRQALTMSATENKVVVIEDIALKTGKTSELVALLTKMKATKNVLLVVENKTDDIVRASNNLQYVKVVQAQYVNTYDAMNADSIVFTTVALDVVTKWLGGDK